MLVIVLGSSNIWCPTIAVTVPGGHCLWKLVRGCAAVMTSFFQASRHSLAYQFTINAPLMWCPPFSIFGKILHLQPCFWPKFQLSRHKMLNFRSQDPSFFEKNPLPRPYFLKPLRPYQPTKKSCVPPHNGTHYNCQYQSMIKCGVFI